MSVNDGRRRRLPERDVAAFRHALVEWFEGQAMDYPWRRTRDPYAVLISEVMLQQTRIAVVVGKGYYQRFLEAFPNVQALASAEEASLLRVWEGLGYYRRARMLHRTAKAIVELCDGIFPSGESALRALPGIGPYTAAALRSFAFEEPAALVDGNVQRVLARLYDDARPIDSTSGIKWAWEKAGLLLDPERPRAYNSALMELGQRICRVGCPDCLLCPVSRWCSAKDPAALPVKGKKTMITHVEESVILALDDSQRCLMAPERGDRRQGLWRLPLRDVIEGKMLWEGSYAITRYKVVLRVYEDPCGKAQKDESWFPIEELESIPVSAPYRRVLRELI
jgi:A/G-specific adenine glycosylase